jgi:hypothetical protein
MEAVAGESFRGRYDSLRRLIDDVFMADEDAEPHRLSKRRKLSRSRDANNSSIGSDFHIDNSSPGDEVRGPLTRFVRYVAEHDCVRSASPWDRHTTLRELRVYLHAHVTQLEDNMRLSKAQTCATKFSHTLITSNHGFIRWVRTTSADHTACQHLATMCRMYNDYGSVARDRAEYNLNSVDFYEFNCEARNEGRLDEVSELEAAKETLFELAQYERGCLSDAICRLREEMCDVKMNLQMDILSMFCDVTDLYGQIYVVKDISSRLENKMTTTQT